MELKESPDVTVMRMIQAIIESGYDEEATNGEIIRVLDNAGVICDDAEITEFRAKITDHRRTCPDCQEQYGLPKTASNDDDMQFTIIVDDTQE